MVFDPTKDFLGLWRNNAGQVSKLEMPGLDYVVATLARGGLITLSVSATPPVVSQPTTAWLQAAVPSYSAEGVLRLWDAPSGAYAAATPALLLRMLQVAAAQNGVSLRTCTAGPPINTVGNDGDFAIRTDEPGGIYGPKAAGTWPANPIPGTTDIIGSTQLDLAFGLDEGLIIYRGPAVWQSLPIGPEDTIFTSIAGVPAWVFLTNLLDTLAAHPQGALLYRDALGWQSLPPSAAGQVLATGGPGANPLWAPRTAEFPSGTSMLFRQTAAPTGWTKQTAINDYGLRVTSGVVGITPGSAFSTVFAQSATQNTTLSAAQMPSHNHAASGSINTTTALASPGQHSFADQSVVTTTSAGGDGPHQHSINLSLSYVDVIIATKV